MVWIMEMIWKMISIPKQIQHILSSFQSPNFHLWHLKKWQCYNLRVSRCWLLRRLVPAGCDGRGTVPHEDFLAFGLQCTVIILTCVFFEEELYFLHPLFKIPVQLDFKIADQYWLRLSVPRFWINFYQVHQTVKKNLEKRGKILFLGGFQFSTIPYLFGIQFSTLIFNISCDKKRIQYFWH